MAPKVWLLSRVVIGLLLVLNLAGCAQTQTFLQEDSAAVKQQEKMEWVEPQGSGQSTDWSLYMDEQGGGP